MDVTQRFAIAATFAAVAVGTASTAWADQTMSGHYIETTTNSAGESVSNDWYFNPCGDGCADVSRASGPMGRAQLVNGQWTLDGTADVKCPDGTVSPGAATTHWTWDPNTLVGTVQSTTNGVCGRPPGNVSMNFKLRQAP
jgi:hypothetical protein